MGHGRGPRQGGHPVPVALEGEEQQARIFGGPVLVAGEEARPCAGGQHAQVLPRADAPGARLRPASGGWREQYSFGSARWHGNPAEERIARVDSVFPGRRIVGSGSV